MTAYTLLEDTLLQRLDDIRAQHGEPMVLRLGWVPYGIVWRECRRLFGEDALDAQLTVWHGVPIVLAGEQGGLVVVWRMTTRNVEVERRR